MRCGRLVFGVAVAVSLGLQGGCADEPPAPLTPEVFPRPVGVERGQPTDQPGHVEPPSSPTPRSGGAAPAGGAGGISPVVADVVQPRTPTTRPATLPVGQYMSVGGVVATVSGEPIFADELLRQIEPVLAARAPDLDERAFAQLARSEIDKQLKLLINSELEFAAANRNLDAAEKERARGATTLWRERQITEAGGSLVVARARAREQGMDFDEMVEQQYRLYLVRLYYEKRVFPRVQISADDIRRYYERNRAEQFTERATARWRMIKVSAKTMGSVDAAEQKARELYERTAGRGEDFAAVASNFNHDATLLRNAGDVGTIDKGAYRLESIEEKAWSLEPGQVAPPVRVGDDFFLVKLEEKRAGRVVPFEEPGVQARIREALQREQFAQLRERAQQELQREAVGAINVNQDMVRTAMEIAMQNYPKWSKP